MLLHNAGAHFRIIHNDLMIHITYISTKKIMLFIAILFFVKGPWKSLAMSTNHVGLWINKLEVSKFKRLKWKEQ